MTEIEGREPFEKLVARARAEDPGAAPIGLARLAELAAEWRLAVGESEDGCELLGAADALRRRLGLARTLVEEARFDRCRRLAVSELGDARRDVALSRGGSAKLAELLERALVPEP